MLSNIDVKRLYSKQDEKLLSENSSPLADNHGITTEVYFTSNMKKIDNSFLIKFLLGKSDCSKEENSLTERYKICSVKDSVTFPVPRTNVSTKSTTADIFIFFYKRR